jgi:hypothetical protein
MSGFRTSGLFDPWFLLGLVGVYFLLFEAYRLSRHMIRSRPFQLLAGMAILGVVAAGMALVVPYDKMASNLSLAWTDWTYFAWLFVLPSALAALLVASITIASVRVGRRIRGFSGPGILFVFLASISIMVLTFLYQFDVYDHSLGGDLRLFELMLLVVAIPPLMFAAASELASPAWRRMDETAHATIAIAVSAMSFFVEFFVLSLTLGFAT